MGSALLLGASVGESVQASPRLKALNMNTLPDRPIISALDTDEITPTVRHVSISMPPEHKEWTKSDARRFADLATMRASGKASVDDENEFGLLQQRRRLNYTGSPDDVLTEWRRRRFVEGILNILSSNVRFLKSEDKAKLRTLRKT